MLVHFSITFVVVVLSILYKRKYRRRILLPIIMIILAAYWGFAYDYGLDYWSYYDYFYTSKIDSITREPLFWRIFVSFGKYYQFILFYGFFVAFSLFLFLRKYLDVDYYWFFFLVFMIYPSLSYAISCAYRSSLASCFIWFGISKFYIDKKNTLLFIMMVLLASLIHRSTLIFLILPVFHWAVMRMKDNFMLITLFLSIILSASLSILFFESITSSIKVFGDYEGYSETRMNETSLIMILSRMIHLVPAYYIVKNRKESPLLSKFSVLALFYYYIYFMGLDLFGRYSMAIYYFVIFASIMIAKKEKIFVKLLILLPMFIFVAQRNVQFHLELWGSNLMRPGNMLTYKSIFDTPVLP